MSAHKADATTLQQITKPVAELYLGTSQSIRDTAEKLMKMHVLLNGDTDQGLSQVAALVSAIHDSGC